MSESTRDRELRMACEERFEAWRKLLPDSRLRNRHISLPSPIGEVVPIFCLNCGTSGGAVTKHPDLPEVVYICRSCAETHGGLPVPSIPEDEFNTMRRG